LLLVAFLLVNAPNCHLSLVLASVVQGDAVNCTTVLNASVKWCQILWTLSVAVKRYKNTM